MLPGFVRQRSRRTFLASCSTRATQRMRGELLRESPTSSQIAMETAYLRFLSVTSKARPIEHWWMRDRCDVDGSVAAGLPEWG